MHSVYETNMRFSYGQFSIFDSASPTPTLRWTDRHLAQGFARRGDAATFDALLSAGAARTRVFLSTCSDPRRYTRLLLVPFRVTKGTVVLAHPEALPEERGSFSVPPGHYRLFVGQHIEASNSDRLSVDLFFERTNVPQTRSRIIVADAALTAGDTLLETAEDEIV